jgi:hypothetical protein
MKKINLATVCLLSILLFFSCSKKETETVEVKTIDFENLNPGNQLYWNGTDLSGSFVSGDMTFPNNYSTEYFSWDSFAYSQKADVSTPGYGNQYSVFDAANGSNRFAIYYPPFVSDSYASFPAGIEKRMRSIDVCNSTYAALSMRDGDNYAKKFGGISGNDQDWFKMTVIGYNAAGDSIGAVNFYLADYRFSNNASDYIINKWTPVDLTSLGQVNKITFRFSSTDNGTYGMNTPAIVCLDNIKYENVTP